MISSAHLSMFKSNARLDLVSTERRCQPKNMSRRLPHDLRSKFTNRRNGSGHVACARGSAGVLQTDRRPKLVETLPALVHRRDCSSEFGFGLVFLAAGHDGDG